MSELWTEGDAKSSICTSEKNNWVYDGPFTPRGVSNKKVNCWDTLTGNAEGNQQPSLWMPRPGAMRRFIDYPIREYPTSEGEVLWLRNESMI